jgi:uncharacterized alpha-E superfamily protein
MLSSTAKNLYWMGRYLQRAENTVRLLEATHRMNLQAVASNTWSSVAIILGQGEPFAARYPSPTLTDLLDYMMLEEANPSSVFRSIRAARDNARAERNNLTTDVWEHLNGLWLEVAQLAAGDRRALDHRGVLETIKRETLTVAGAASSTLVRDDAFNFLALGTYIERADNTARILDVKYHIILPRGEKVGGSLDYYQWSEVLSCIGAFRTYRRVYSSRIEPWRVAELMVLHPGVPRSLHFSMRQVEENLDALATAYGRRGEANRLAGEIASQLRYGRIDSIFAMGLHEFLTDFIERTAKLSDEIGRQFLLD